MNSYEGYGNYGYQPTDDSGKDFSSNKAVIKVIGVGGGGCNAVNSMIDSGVDSAEFFAVNTDSQALVTSKAKNRIQIGNIITKGLGAGSNPDVGRASAEESKEEIAKVLQGTDLLFIAAGMGGGTGTGAAPVIAEIAHGLGILTVAVVTKPFSFEGIPRSRNAEKGISQLKEFVDTLVIIPNDKLLEYLPAQVPLLEAFKIADDMLKQGVLGIVELIATNSLINLDFADVKTVMQDRGLAHMGIGKAEGEKRVIEAVRQAVSSPLLETTIEGAKALILNVTGGKNLKLSEVNEAAVLIQGIIDSSANIIFGATIDEKMSEEIKITVIATGFSSKNDGEKDSTVLDFKKKEEELPLLRFEEKPAEVKPEETPAPVVETEPQPEPVVEVQEEQEEVQPETEKKRSLPPFMARLFKK